MKRKIIMFVLAATFAFGAMAGMYACGSSSSATSFEMSGASS